jgi:hypothetical protein
LATKGDLSATKEGLGKALSATKEALRRDIHELEIRLMKRTFAMPAAPLVALLKPP